MSGFLLDTNVVCETTKPQPDARVLAWVGWHSGDAVFISAITLGEVRHGALLLDEGRRKQALLECPEPMTRTETLITLMEMAVAERNSGGGQVRQ